MDPQSDARQIADALRLVEREADSYLASLDTALVKPPMAAEASPIHRLPDHGTGSVAALEELVAAAVDGATRSAGPRFFHFVIGGVTPAALAADWLTSTLDQNAYNWVSSPFGSRMEQVTMSWLRELFGIPAGGAGC